MNLEHVALNIADLKEIENFYCGILGMSEIRHFVLEKNLASEIFGIEKETTVFQLQKNEILLEIFLMPERFENGFSHLCISLSDREEMANKADQNGYSCMRLKRGNSDMIFIKDKSGNIFELKQTN